MEYDWHKGETYLIEVVTFDRGGLIVTQNKLFIMQYIAKVKFLCIKIEGRPALIDSIKALCCRDGPWHELTFDPQ